MIRNPLHWRNVLANFRPSDGTFNPAFPQPVGGPTPAGFPTILPCPSVLRPSLRVVARVAFQMGVDRAALVDGLLDVEGWSFEPFESEHVRRVEVIVPVRGAHKSLALCLACLYAHTDPEAFELALPHAKDEHEAVLGAWSACVDPQIVHRHLRTRTHTPTTLLPQSFALNVALGASCSSSEFIVLLNSDAFVGPGWLEKILAPFDDPEVVAVGPMGTNVSGHQGVNLLPVHGRTLPAEIRTVEDVARCTRGRDGDAAWMPMFPSAVPYAARRLVGFCVAIRRSAWDLIGGIDVRFENAYCDDDLSLRLSLVGKCVVVPDLLVLHEGSASFAEMPEADSTYRRTLIDNGARFAEKWDWIMPFVRARLDGQGVR